MTVEADRLQAHYGPDAYGVAVERHRAAPADSAAWRFAWAVRCELADRLGQRIGLDTATRYLVDPAKRSLKR